MKHYLPISELHRVFDINLKTGIIHWKINTIKKKAGEEAGGFDKQLKTHIIKFDRREYRREEIIWAVATGSWPEKRLKRINKDRSDDRLNNLIQKEDLVYLKDGIITYPSTMTYFIAHNVKNRADPSRTMDVFDTFLEAKEFWLTFHKPL